MKKQFEFLAKLQDIDLQIVQLRKNITEKPLKIEKLEAEFNIFENASKREADKLDKLEREKRTYELDLQEGGMRITKSKENLMHIKSNKEYKAALKEIATIEKENRAIEDNILLCMENIETINAALAEKKGEVLKRKDVLEKEKRKIEEEIHQDERKLASMMEQRNQMVEEIDQKVVKKYDQLQKRGGIRVVARVKNAICLGCNMNIPPQLYNEVQKFDSIRLCPYCQRILYYKKEM